MGLRLYFPGPRPLFPNCSMLSICTGIKFTLASCSSQRVHTVLLEGLVTPEGNEVNFITLEGQGSGKIKNSLCLFDNEKKQFFKEQKYVFNDIQRSLEILTQKPNKIFAYLRILHQRIGCIDNETPCVCYKYNALGIRSSKH